MGALVGWAERSHANALRARERFDGLEDAEGRIDAYNFDAPRERCLA
jgi:hypothetical protein